MLESMTFQTRCRFTGHENYTMHSRRLSCALEHFQSVHIFKLFPVFFLVSPANYITCILVDSIVLDSTV